MFVKMSRIIRSSRFFLPAFKVSRILSSTIYLKCNPIRSQDFKFKLFNLFPKAFSSANTDIMPLSAMEKSIDQLNIDAKFKQKINLRDINEILSAVEHWGTLNYHHSIILLRCCGSLSLDIGPEKKLELIQRALSLFENAGIELNISHYNSLLTAYIESEQVFSPKEFLNSIHEKKLVPNKITYQRLLKACCQHGDIVGASELLEKIKEEKFGLNEDIFNSLIYGHCQVNDMASASSILDLMKNKGIEPSSETYVNLACGYAKVGQIWEIRKILNDCISKDIILFDKDYLQIAYALAINGQTNYIDEILDKMKKHFGYESHVRHTVLKLLQKNLDSIALKIFETTKVKTDSAENTKNGQYLINYMIECRPVKDVINLCQHLRDKDLVNSSFSIALKELLQLGETGKAFEMFSAMANQKLPIRTHYFWPLLIKASKDGNDGILHIVARMKASKIRLCFYTLTKIIFPNYKLGENWKKDIDKLRIAGIEETYINRVLLKWFLTNGKFEEAKKLASASFFSHKTGYFTELILENLLSTKNAEFFVEMLYIFLHDQICLNEVNSKSNFNSEIEKNNFKEPKICYKEEFMNNIMTKLAKICDEQLMLLVLQAMLEKKINISSKVTCLMEQKFKSEEIKELINKLSDKNMHLDLNDNILSIKKKNQLLHLTENMQEIIRLAKGPINSQAKAVRIIKDILGSRGEIPPNIETKKFKAFMMTLAKAGNYEAVEEVYQLGLDHNIIRNKNFYPLVYALIVSDKLEKATDLFCQKVLETQCKSSWPELVSRLIQVENAGLLQKVTDVMTQIDSEEFSIAMLITQFAKLGKVKEIQKLLDAKSLMFPKKSLDYVCYWLYTNNSVAGLENLLDATKKNQSLNRTNIFDSLLKIYTFENNSDKAMALWWRMEEENVVPTSFFLREFEIFHRKMKKPLPFMLQSTELKETKLEDATS